MAFDDPMQELAARKQKALAMGGAKKPKGVRLELNPLRRKYLF